jgi:hypothetical protein
MSHQGPEVITTSNYNEDIKWVGMYDSWPILNIGSCVKKHVKIQFYDSLGKHDIPLEQS